MHGYTLMERLKSKRIQLFADNKNQTCSPLACLELLALFVISTHFQLFFLNCCSKNVKATKICRIKIMDGVFTVLMKLMPCCGTPVLIPEINIVEPSISVSCC